MANEEQVNKLQEGVEAWNQWRWRNQGVQIDLREANLSRADLSLADLSKANLYFANLDRARLDRVDLCGADLSRAALWHANLDRADLSRASKSTRNLRLAILSSFYKYALDRYLLAPMDDAGHVMNPLTIVSREKVEAYQGIHWLEPEEAQNALNKIDRSTELGKRDYALLVVLLNTGRRLKEVASLEWCHVRFKGQRITLTFEHCKRDKTMIDTLNVANSKALLTWLHAYYGSDLASLNKHAPLWVTLSRNTKQAGQPLGIQGIQQVCGKYLEVHTHITRHTFTKLMIKAGATLPEIQARLGHESLATTGIYAHALSSDENPHADKIAAVLGIE